MRRWRGIIFGVLIGLSVSFEAHAGLDEVSSCKYEVQKKGRVYMDMAAMFRDSPLVVMARVGDVSGVDDEGDGVLHLIFSHVLKGRKDLPEIDINYSQPLCIEVDCGGNKLPVSPRQYLFFLDRGTHGLATRMTCYGTAVNGWADSDNVYFTEKFKVPWDDLPKFLQNSEALVPEN